jgi:hypothetical protein
MMKWFSGSAGKVRRDVTVALMAGEMTVGELVARGWALIAYDADGRRVHRLDRPTFVADPTPALVWSKSWPGLGLRSEDGECPVGWVLVAGEQPIAEWEEIPSGRDVVIYFGLEGSRLSWSA